MEKTFSFFVFLLFVFSHGAEADLHQLLNSLTWCVASVDFCPAKVDLTNLTLVSTLRSECSSLREPEEPQLPVQGAAGKQLCCASLGDVTGLKPQRERRQTLTIIVALLDLLCRPIYQHVQGPDHAGDGNDVESDRAEDFPPFAGGHLQFLPLQAQTSYTQLSLQPGNLAPHLYPRPGS